MFWMSFMFTPSLFHSCILSRYSPPLLHKISVLNFQPSLILCSRRPSHNSEAKHNSRVCLFVLHVPFSLGFLCNESIVIIPIVILIILVILSLYCFPPVFFNDLVFSKWTKTPSKKNTTCKIISYVRWWSRLIW